MRYIYMTPTWEEILGTLLRIRDNGDAKGQEFANKELIRMAKFADLFKESQKKETAQ